MIQQNRSNIKEYFEISERIKRYGNYFSVQDIDTCEDLIYQVASRGVYPVNFELKAYRIKEGNFIGPSVNIHQLLQLFFSPIPTLLCYYGEEYCYKVTPANYSGVYFFNFRETKILSEIEFQKLFSKVSPCLPTKPCNNIIIDPKEYIYFDKYGNQSKGELYPSFEAIIDLVKEYNQKGSIDRAWKEISLKLDPSLAKHYKELFNLYRKLSKDIV